MRLMSPNAYTDVILWKQTHWSLARLPITPSEEVAAMYYGGQPRCNCTRVKQVNGTLNFVQGNITSVYVGYISNLQDQYIFSSSLTTLDYQVLADLRSTIVHSSRKTTQD